MLTITIPRETSPTLRVADVHDAVENLTASTWALCHDLATQVLPDLRVGTPEHAYVLALTLDMEDEVSATYRLELMCEYPNHPTVRALVRALTLRDALDHAVEVTADREAVRDAVRQHAVRG